MKRYERVLLCIDRPDRDSYMLAYVRAIARHAESREIHVLHVADDTAAGRLPPPDAPGNGAPTAAAEITRETLRAIAAEHFGEQSSRVCRCEVVQGAPLLEVLRFAHDKEADLIVIGRHYGRTSETDDEALLARRVARKATCSVLVLPEDHQVKIETILVPVRDSECSANALDVACGIAAATDGAVIALNVYQIHAGYSRVGVTMEEHQALLEASAQRECRKLLERVDTRSASVLCKCAPDPHGKPVPVVLEGIVSVTADLVVIGARGRSGAAGVLLGTVTEQLIRRSTVPVLAVKKKGECLGILRALLTLAAEE